MNENELRDELEIKYQFADACDKLKDICADVSTVKVAIQHADWPLSPEAEAILMRRLSDAYATAFDLQRRFNDLRKLG